MTTDTDFPWRYAAACGVLWGVAVVLADTLAQPVADLWTAQWLLFNLTQMINWSLAGLVWACGTKLAEASRHAMLLLVLTAVCAWTLTVALNVTPVMGRNPFVIAGGREARDANVADLTVYILWNNLFYGGLYVAGFFTTRRAMRLGRRLAELRLARSVAEARLREVRLRTFRGQLQPATLLEALGALQQRYRATPVSADDLFDHIIAFLRAAMPGLRSGSSSLSAELAVVRRYAELRGAIDRRPPFRLALAEPAFDVPFPSMRLLPGLDGISRLAQPWITLDVVARPDGDDFVIQVSADPRAAIPAAAMARLRAESLRAFGADPMATAAADGPLLLELRLRRAASTPPDPPSLVKENDHAKPTQDTLPRRCDLPRGRPGDGPERGARAAQRLSGRA